MNSIDCNWRLQKVGNSVREASAWTIHPAQAESRGGRQLAGDANHGKPLTGAEHLVPLFSRGERGFVLSCRPLLPLGLQICNDAKDGSLELTQRRIIGLEPFSALHLLKRREKQLDEAGGLPDHRGLYAWMPKMVPPKWDGIIARLQ